MVQFPFEAVQCFFAALCLNSNVLAEKLHGTWNAAGLAQELCHTVFAWPAWLSCVIHVPFISCLFRDVKKTPGAVLQGRAHLLRYTDPHSPGI